MGLTSGIGKNHIIRAALEAIAYQTEDVLAAMNADMKEIYGDSFVSVLRVDGGASANSLLMQMQSDFSNVGVQRSANAEATAAGAAYLAGLATGFFKSRDEIKSMIGVGKIFEPQITKEARQKALGGWRRAIRACRIFSESEDR